MPVEVIKYTCAFRCGKRAASDKGTVKAHEDKCWKNPHNKTCKTCSNEIYTTEYDEHNPYIVRGCKITQIDLVLEETFDILKFQNNVHVRPIYHCPYHNLPDDGKAKDFADILRGEIDGEVEGTTHYPFYNKPKKEDAGKEILPF